MDQVLYDILEVPKTASIDDIKKSYKKLCIRYHPDKGGDENHFKKITEAYNILKDPEKRKVYDKFGMDGVKGGAGMNSNGTDADMMNAMMNDFFGGGGGGNPFGSFFHGGPPQHRNNQTGNVMRVLKIKLEDVVCGNPNMIYKHSRKVIKQSKALIKCDLCEGRGSRAVQSNMGFMKVMQEVECPKCHGKCFSNLDQCRETVNESIRIEIPRDCQEGDRIVLKKSTDEHPVHGPGDLVLQIEFEEHALFKRIQGSLHLYYVVEVSLYESLFGFYRTIKYLDGSEIHIHCPKMTLNHSLIPFIPTKGLYDKRSNSRQHLFILVKPTIPPDHIMSPPAKFIPYLLEESQSEKNQNQKQSTDPKKILTPLSFFKVQDTCVLSAVLQGMGQNNPSPPSSQRRHHGPEQPQCAQQ